MSIRPGRMKRAVFMILTATTVLAGGCSLQELFPVQEFARDFVLGWVAALLL